MPDPNLVLSGLSKNVLVEGIDLRIEICRLEHEREWTLEVVDDKGTSTVWDDVFATDQEALNEALKTIREEGLAAFRDNGNVIPFPK